MLNCKECNTPTPEANIIHSLDGYSMFFQCEKCQWFTQVITGTPQKGYAEHEYLLSKNAPFDLVTDDIAQQIIGLTKKSPDGLGWTPMHGQMSLLVKGIVVRFLVDYAKMVGNDEVQAQNYCVIAGLLPSRPQKQFTVKEEVKSVVNPTDN